MFLLTCGLLLIYNLIQLFKILGTASLILMGSLLKDENKVGHHQSGELVQR